MNDAQNIIKQMKREKRRRALKRGMTAVAEGVLLIGILVGLLGIAIVM